MKKTRINGINYSFADSLNVNITVDEDNTTVMTTRDQSVEWIMNTVFDNCSLSIFQYDELHDKVAEMVNYWEDILAKEIFK